jgi:hypothetical protein
VDFKEAEAQGWKKSQPGDEFLKGKWWEIYNDAALNTLEGQVSSLSNQNVLHAEIDVNSEPRDVHHGFRGIRARDADARVEQDWVVALAQ